MSKSPAPDAETTLVAREAIDRALAELPDELRLALILRDSRGLDYKEIAGATGAPIGTVESRILRPPGGQRAQQGTDTPDARGKPPQGRTGL